MRLLVRASLLVAVALAVLASTAALSGAPAILHKLPRPDSIGPMPLRFEWSEVPGAESYSFGMWTEFDVNLVKMDDIHATAVTWPNDVKPLDPGTYYWSVSAFDGNQPIAESGLAAFVVK